MAAAARDIEKCTDLTAQQAYGAWGRMKRASKKANRKNGVYTESDIEAFLNQDGGSCRKKVEQGRKMAQKQAKKDAEAKKKKEKAMQSAASKKKGKPKPPDMGRVPSESMSMAHQSIYDEYRDYDLVDAQGQALYVPGYTNGYSYYAPPALGSSSGAGSTDFVMIMAIGLAAFVLVCLVCLMISVVIGAGCFLYNQRAKQVVKYQALRDEQV